MFGGVERAGKRMTGGNRAGCSNGSFGDTVNEQVVLPACGAPYVECDNMISALKLATNMKKGSKLGVGMKGPY